ncbi:extensin family protein [Rhodopseudomonas palustris]|uniref:extensin-like domain-containing protein n=1 Tax=Rhodopseudomonas palustris TaxID=1076 RepID=UPI0020CE157A|nr:extensin family protein [Rhodopseudomonas palustris]MCP9627405.1 extensin family protein [Rhodopseudomonas palustris]
MLIALAAAGVPTAQARERIPLPKPRPAAAPQPEDDRAAAGAEQRPDNEPAGASPPQQPPAQADAAKPQPKPPSACRLALSDAIAIAPSIADITGPGSCGGTDLVRLEAIVLPDGSRVAVTPAAILRCPMAAELADWVRTDVAPLASSLESRLAGLDNFDSYECRGRNRQRGAKLSEHGKANAIDIRGLKLASGRLVSLTDRASPRAIRESVRQSVCDRFSTVLGPGSDGFHEDHIHLDLAQRRKDYRMCQWDVLEPMPQIAPLLPAPRPDEAPPREVAADQPQDRERRREPQSPAPAQAQPEQSPEQAGPEGEQAAEPAPPPAPAKKAKAKARPKKPRAERQSDQH